MRPNDPCCDPWHYRFSAQKLRDDGESRAAVQSQQWQEKIAWESLAASRILDCKLLRTKKSASRSKPKRQKQEFVCSLRFGAQASF